MGASGACEQETADVRAGVTPAEAGPWRAAPHTAYALAGVWDRAYDRAGADFPAGVDPTDKYWPPVARIDGAYGDRHLVCSCPPPEEFED